MPELNEPRHYTDEEYARLQRIAKNLGKTVEEVEEMLLKERLAQLPNPDNILTFPVLNP